MLCQYFSSENSVSLAAAELALQLDVLLSADVATPASATSCGTCTAVALEAATLVEAVIEHGVVDVVLAAVPVGSHHATSHNNLFP
jgi:hypothetical protein